MRPLAPFRIQRPRETGLKELFSIDNDDENSNDENKKIEKKEDNGENRKDENESDDKKRGGDDDDRTSVVISELKRLNRSLCFNFLELINILVSERPSELLKEDESTTLLDRETFQKDLLEGGGLVSTEPLPAHFLKVQQIRLLLLNMSYLLNRLRPVQARQQLISIMEHSSERREGACQSLQQTLSQCKAMLQQTRQVLAAEDSGPTPAAAIVKKRDFRESGEQDIPPAKILKKE